jgi:membrane protein YdbS with pleckstrin-like domain
MPDTTSSQPENGKNSADQNPKWWNPTWTVTLSVVFAVYVVALFIACRYWVGHPNDTPAFVSGVIGLLTLYAIIVQLVINRHQWRTMREAMAQAERHFILSERPLFMVESVEAPLTRCSVIHPKVTISNKGRSAAYEIKIFHELTEPLKPLRFPSNIEWQEPREIPAQCSVTFHDTRSETTSWTFDDTLYDLVVEGIHPVYVIGKGTYEDAFGNEYQIKDWLFAWDGDWKTWLMDDMMAKSDIQ